MGKKVGSSPADPRLAALLATHGHPPDGLLAAIRAYVDPELGPCGTAGVPILWAPINKKRILQHGSKFESLCWHANCQLPTGNKSYDTEEACRAAWELCRDCQAAAAPAAGPSVAPRKPPRKQPRELQGLGPILPYGPTHRGPTVTARKSTGPPAPKPPAGFRGFGAGPVLFRAVTAPKMQANRLQVEAAKARGRPLKSNEAAGRSLASVARPPWQPQWTWLPLEDCGEFCFSTKWFWRTLATARPSTGGPGTSADAAAKLRREWEQRHRDEGIVSGRQYGRWEQSATGSKRWRRGVPKEERPWDS